MRQVGQDPLEEHCTADQLSAFACDDLPETERDYISAHLSGCAICQGKLALITPEEGPPARIALPRRRSS